MTDLQALTPVPDHDPLITRGRMDDLDAWAEDAVLTILQGGDQDAAISGGTLDHEVVWTKGGRTYHTTISTTGSQPQLDDAVAAFKARVVANGGSVVSG